MHVMPSSGPPLSKFIHPAGVRLTLQCAVIVRDAERKIAAVKLADFPDGWRLPIENMFLNEDPADAAKRVAKLWFDSPLDTRLATVFSYPPTGGEDDKWYLLFVYEADAPADLKVTSDTEELTFVPAGKAPGPWGAAHHEVFDRLSG